MGFQLMLILFAAVLAGSAAQAASTSSAAAAKLVRPITPSFPSASSASASQKNGSTMDGAEGRNQARWWLAFAWVRSRLLLELCAVRAERVSGECEWDASMRVSWDQWQWGGGATRCSPIKGATAGQAHGGAQAVYPGQFHGRDPHVRVRARCVGLPVEGGRPLPVATARDGCGVEAQRWAPPCGAGSRAVFPQQCSMDATAFELLCFSMSLLLVDKYMFAFTFIYMSVCMFSFAS